VWADGWDGKVVLGRKSGKCLTLPPVAAGIRVHDRTPSASVAAAAHHHHQRAMVTSASFPFHHCHNFVSQFRPPPILQAGPMCPRGEHNF